MEKRLFEFSNENINIDVSSRVAQNLLLRNNGKNEYLKDIYNFEKDGEKSSKWALKKLLINTRCTESSIWAICLGIGLAILAMQAAPIFMLNWIHITEPRPINQTDEKGDPIEAPFFYNAGYFRMCRWLATNISMLYNETEIRIVYPNICVWNFFGITGEDLGEYSFATNAILMRLLVPTVLHIFGTLITLLAFLLSIFGHIKQDKKTLYSAIFYILGGLVVLVGMLQLICIVDDEMYPRMKPNMAGEPSGFSFHYGFSFLATALSFLPIQLCIYFQTTTFFKRFPKPFDKCIVVPGLIQLLQQANTIQPRSHQLELAAQADNLKMMGSSGFYARARSSNAGINVNFAGRRRESRSSKDFGVYGVQQEVRSIAPPLTQSFVRRPSAQL